MSELNVSVVGLGSIAEYHLRSFAKLPGVNLHAVMSRNQKSVDRAVSEYHVDKGFQDYNEMLSDPKTDAVVVCSPSDLHFEMARSALKAGKHVLVEKPLASNLKEARRLCRLADQCSRTLMVAMTARFTPQYLEAFHSIRGGRIGEIIQIVIRWFENKTIGVNWEKKQVPIDEKTSTVLYHHGSHMLDAALWFAGDELADIHVAGAKRQVLNDDVAVLMRTKKGIIITSVHSFNSSQEHHDVVVIGTKGVVEITGYEELKVNGQTRVKTTWDQGLEQGVNNQAAEFADSIRQNRPPVAAGRALLASFDALDRAYLQLQRQGLA